MECFHHCCRTMLTDQEKKAYLSKGASNQYRISILRTDMNRAFRKTLKSSNHNLDIQGYLPVTSHLAFQQDITASISSASYKFPST